MPKAKGTIKTGGRMKGTPNKVTRDLRCMINSFLDANIDNLQKDFDQLEPKDRLMIFEKLIKYSLPIQTSITETNPKRVIALPNGTEIDLS